MSHSTTSKEYSKSSQLTPYIAKLENNKQKSTLEISKGYGVSFSQFPKVINKKIFYYTLIKVFLIDWLNTVSDQQYHK